MNTNDKQTMNLMIAALVVVIVGGMVLKALTQLLIGMGLYYASAYAAALIILAILGFAIVKWLEKSGNQFIKDLRKALLNAVKSGKFRHI